MRIAAQRVIISISLILPLWDWLLKTTELNSSPHNLFFGFHPPGILVVRSFDNFCMEAMLMLPSWSHLPIFWDYWRRLETARWPGQERFLRGASGKTQSTECSVQLPSEHGACQALLVWGFSLRVKELALETTKALTWLWALMHLAPGSSMKTGGLGMEAPSPSPTKKTRGRRWLESASALHYVTTFLFLGAFSTILLFLLIFTSLWSISLLYFTWLYLDWDTPSQGGRCSTWMRNRTIWKYLRDYFPIKLVKTTELPPDRNYVMGAHPHGIMCIGYSCNFCTESNAFSQQFPGLRPFIATLAGLFRLPIYRDFLMFSGFCSVDRQNLDYILSENPCGQLVVIIVGGAQEMLYSGPGQHCLNLLNRKGFVRLALRHGASLVPIYSFGENDIFNVKTFPTDSWQYRCQMTFKKLVGFAPCIFFGQSLFSAKSWGLMPFHRPITTVVGRPIDMPQALHPTEEDVDHYHTLYLKALDRLFEEHKESYGVPADAHLTFL
ncbi:2-acylglycerol O-acyltransferase 3-like [Tenrec ecaudatus]|uniref:2-acylglycerol O-acyltransferase 3-like n=1 Tax=Tenrec ecaudatus TaxID=94439 RepID=UPI003F5A0F15